MKRIIIEAPKQSLYGQPQVAILALLSRVSRIATGSATVVLPSANGAGAIYACSPMVYTVMRRWYIPLTPGAIYLATALHRYGSTSGIVVGGEAGRGFSAGDLFQASASSSASGKATTGGFSFTAVAVFFYSILFYSIAPGTLVKMVFMGVSGIAWMVHICRTGRGGSLYSPDFVFSYGDWE